MPQETDIQHAVRVISDLKRLMLPAFMSLAEAELVDEPVPDEAVVYHFMGSGASDSVTAGEFRKVLKAANTFLERHEQPAPMYWSVQLDDGQTKEKFSAADADMVFADWCERFPDRRVTLVEVTGQTIRERSPFDE